MALKFVLLLCQLGLVASLSPGDCAFVGIYGDQDDFALVIMEDVHGEVLSLTEEAPSNGHFEVSNFAVAKKHVNAAKRGTVLKKADFDTDTKDAFVAPTALTVFTGSAEFPTALCSINLQSRVSKPSVASRQLSQEAVVMLGLTETAQYAGATHGSKDDLLEEISNPSNWLRDASRKLSAFSIASSNGTSTETSTTNMIEGERTVVSGCTELSGPISELVGSSEAVTLFTGILSSLAGVPEAYVQDVTFVPDGACAVRRLSHERRLQTLPSGTVTYNLVFPGSLGTVQAAEAAEAADTALGQVTVEELNVLLAAEIIKFDSLKDLTFEITSLPTLVVTESAGTTTTTTTTTTSVTGTIPSGEEESSAVCQGGLALVLLTVFLGPSIA